MKEGKKEGRIRREGQGGDEGRKEGRIRRGKERRTKIILLATQT